MAKKSKSRVYHGNLTNTARYNVFLRDYEHYAEDPYKGIGVFDTLLKNVGPGSRFFFFTSLANYHGPWASKLPSVLAWNTALNDMTVQEGLHYEGKMLSILQLIHGFRTFEANNEYTYFKEKLQPLLEINPELYQLFADTFQDNQIDYPKFMALVLSLNQDIFTVQSEIDNLAQHTRKWDQAYRNAFKSAKELHSDKYNQYGNDELFNLAYRKEIGDEARKQIDYETSKIEQHLSSGIIDLKKVLNNINSDDTENIIPKLRIIGNQMLANNETQLSGKKLDNALGTQRLQKEHVLAFYRELKRMATAYDTDVAKLLTGLKESLEYSTIMPNGHPAVRKNNGLPTYISSDNQKLINELTQYLITLIQDDTIALSQYEELMKKANKKNKLAPRINKGGESSEQWAGLIKRRRQLIIQALRQLPQSEKNTAAIDSLLALEADKESGGGKININGKSENFDIRKKTHFKAYIELIRQALNMQERSKLTSIIEKLEVALKSSEAYDRQAIITVTSEHGNALDLNRILPNTISIVLNNNFREDSVHVGYLTYTCDNTKMIQKIDADAAQINRALEKTTKYMSKLRSEDIYKMLSKDNTKQGRAAREYDVQSTLEASKAIDIKTAEQLKTELNLEKLEDTIPILKNLFVLEESDKFSTTFNTIENGFKGGSLGAGIEEQVNNINQMLTLGGITPIDANFLISAIMNAGPGMLGYGQKDKIETYLSSIASVCMFTSGAQSIEDYANSILENVQQSYSTTKIHVFKAGTLTVPLSYILGLMEEGLQKCFTLLDTTFQLGGQAGNQVTINNPVNEANDKISTMYYDNKTDRFFYIGDWQATAEAGLPKISLDMAILGSYLDVLDEVNSILKGLI